MTRWPRNFLAAYIGVMLALVVAADVEARRQTKADGPVKLDGPIRAPSPTTQPDIAAGVDLSRVVIRFDCANPAEKTPRGFSHELLAAGSWSKFFEQQIDPEIAWLKSRGVKSPRIIIINPYGVEGEGKNFAFTQRQQCAANAKTLQFAYGLGYEISRLRAAGVQVIVYIGSFVGDPTEAVAANPATARAAISAWDFAVQEIVNSGAELGADYSNDLRPSTPQYHYLRMLESHTRVLRESRLRADMPELHGKPIVITDRFFQDTDPSKVANAKWAASNAQHGEIIRLLQVPDGDAGWNDRFSGDVAARLAAGARRIQADGHVAGVAPGWWSKR